MRKIDAFKNEHELRDRYRGRRHRVITRRNNKRPGLKPLVVQAVSGPVPEQDLDPVPIAVEKHEQVAGQRILVYHSGHHRRQAVETLAQVGRLQADEHLHGGWQREHAVLPGTQWRKHANGPAHENRVTGYRHGDPRAVRQRDVYFLSFRRLCRQLEKRYRSMDGMVGTPLFR
jgi:hypothetical protein